MPCLVCGSKGRGKRCWCTMKARREAAIAATAARNARRQSKFANADVTYTTPAGVTVELHNPNILRMGQVNRRRFLDLAKRLNWSNDNLMDNLLRTYAAHGLHT